jgi:hypothetical protein
MAALLCGCTTEYADGKTTRFDGVWRPGGPPMSSGLPSRFPKWVTRYCDAGRHFGPTRRSHSLRIRGGTLASWLVWIMGGRAEI